MRKRISTTSGIAALSVLAMLAFATIAYAAKPTPIPAAVNGLEHPGQASQLYLYQKNPLNWDEIVSGGAWGKMMFNSDKSTFVFNGHALEPNTDFSLIYYPDPWPGDGLMVLGMGTSDANGNVHIAGNDFDFGLIPIESDLNKDNGAKIWLVLSSDVDDVDPTKMIGWNPTEYLFEYNVLP